MKEDLIQTKIKGRQIIYYLTTEDDLNNLKTKSIYADFFILLFSLLIGGIISIVITKSVSESLSSESIRILGGLIILFIIIGLIFGALAVCCYVSSYRTISKIKGSGEIKSFTSPDSTEPAVFEIIEAKYWTPKKHKDLTKKLKGMIQNNRLEVLACNSIDGDPDVGTRKKLTIKYRHNGISLIKEYNEKEKIELP